MDLSELIRNWENSALELREAERLITLLIIDNRRLDLSEDKLIEQRDHWEEKATELAGDIGSVLGFDVGEHSSANCPVQTAIDGVYQMQSTVIEALAK